MQRACAVCKSSFEAKRAAARYCSQTCKKRAQRSGQAVVRERPGTGDVVALPDREGRSGGDLVSSTERALRDANRLETWQGQSALELARRIEHASADTGSAYASLHRELRTAMTEALRGANQAKSVVQARRDELAERRRLGQRA